MRLIGVFAIVSLIWVGAASAATTRYECVVNYAGQAVATGVNMILSHVDGTETALALDGIAMTHNKGAPYPAKVLLDNDKRITFAWKTDRISDANGKSAQLSFRATFVRSRSEMNVYILPLGGYDNEFQGQGPCQLARVK